MFLAALERLFIPRSQLTRAVAFASLLIGQLQRLPWLSYKDRLDPLLSESADAYCTFYYEALQCILRLICFSLQVLLSLVVHCVWLKCRWYGILPHALNACMSA